MAKKATITISHWLVAFCVLPYLDKDLKKSTKIFSVIYYVLNTVYL